jgi:replicative superfamily II helicase
MRVYTQSALRAQSTSLRVLLGPNGNIALERYLRLAFASNRALTWPSQLRGIARLAEDRSFVLCTPTGSGKTTIAELAIILRLFAPDRGGETEQYGPFDQPPLVIYLVPSRALAAEVEAKLARIVRHFVNPAIRVTALYGGTDFGPTDVWLTANERVVVIATYEKGEALLRFLGARLLQRLALVVIDEAHGVQYEGRLAAHEFAENRALRLEALTARLLTRMDPNQQRVIALSAVAGGIEQALAAWVAGDETAQAEIVTYRSTRQIVGRLECLPDRTFEIRYDLLDGSPL